MVDSLRRGPRKLKCLPRGKKKEKEEEQGDKEKKRSISQQLKTLIHEYGHFLLHAKGAKFEQEGSSIKEAQAEAVAHELFWLWDRGI